MLRIFHLFELDIVVGIVFQMIRDVLLWVGLYWIVLVVFSMLFMGTSDLDTTINMEFVFVYVLICPMFQSLRRIQFISNDQHVQHHNYLFDVLNSQTFSHQSAQMMVSKDNDTELHFRIGSRADPTSRCPCTLQSHIAPRGPRSYGV
jgi:hypothetical protein